MSKTNPFELLTAQNLERIAVSMSDIDHFESFTYLPGTLYPEQGKFTNDHPCGGSFGTHLYLKNGKDAWLYGRLSYDYNPKKDHDKGREHWNYDIIGIEPSGKTLSPYTGHPLHIIPASDIVEIAVAEQAGGFKQYTITKT